MAATEVMFGLDAENRAQPKNDLQIRRELNVEGFFLGFSGLSAKTSLKVFHSLLV